MSADKDFADYAGIERRIVADMVASGVVPQEAIDAVLQKDSEDGPYKEDAYGVLRSTAPAALRDACIATKVGGFGHRWADVADRFAKEVVGEAAIATHKFPPSNPNIAALLEEAGELSKAILHIREGKSQDWDKVWREAVQTAAVALRIATEGDDTILGEVVREVP